jgi:signal transduction histidine kinase
MSAFDYRVLAYVAGLELALDRLRRHLHFLGREAEGFTRAVTACTESGSADDGAALSQLDGEARAFSSLLQDLRDTAPEAGASDVAAPIPVRELLEKVFRRCQRLKGGSQVELLLELDEPEIVWFPVRLEQIVEAMIENAFKGHDPAKGAARIHIRLHLTSPAYELHVTDNGQGLSRAAQARLFDLFARADPARLADPVVGMAVLKLLIEQSGGALRIVSDVGVGASFVAVLPRFPENDFLT